jgi:hypothetical protein
MLVTLRQIVIIKWQFSYQINDIGKDYEILNLNAGHLMSFFQATKRRGKETLY